MHEAALKMIDAAERLVAERGLAALTVQAVQQAAGQRNKSAVQYHFGDRDGLLRTLIEERMRPTNERRTTMLLALGETATTRDLVEVMIRPLAEVVTSTTPSYWARFLLQALNDPATGLAVLETVGHEALQIAIDRLAARLDHVPEHLRVLRVQSLFGYAAVCLAAYEVGGIAPDLSADDLASELVDACFGIVSAPSSVPSGAAIT